MTTKMQKESKLKTTGTKGICPCCGKVVIFLAWNTRQKIMPTVYMADGAEANFDIPVKGNKCPECQNVHCTEELALENIRRAILSLEEMIEA